LFSSPISGLTFGPSFSTTIVSLSLGAMMTLIATPTTTSAATVTRIAIFFARPGLSPCAAMPCWRRTLSSAVHSSAASWNRSAGSFCMSLKTISSSSFGTSETRPDTRGTGAFRCARRISFTEPSGYGFFPVITL
jgi:hypothetical protein